MSTSQSIAKIPYKEYPPQGQSHQDLAPQLDDEEKPRIAFLSVAHLSRQKQPKNSKVTEIVAANSLFTVQKVLSEYPN